MESLSTCHDADTNLIMYFTVNTAFINCIDLFNLTEELTFPILTKNTTLEHTLPISLNDTRVDKTLSSAPQTMKEYISQYKQKKKIWFERKALHYIHDIEFPNKNFFTNNFVVDMFVFTVAIISADNIIFAVQTY